MRKRKDRPVPGAMKAGRASACLAIAFAAALVLSAAPGSRAAEPPPVYAKAGPFDLLGSGRSYIDVGYGIFELTNKRGKRTEAGRIEIRGGRKYAFLGPALGLLGNDDGGRFGYFGIYADLAWRGILLTPQLAVGIYRRGDSLDMGGALEFRESLEVSYPLGERWRAGISFGHISNGNIHKGNPGQEDLLLTIAAGF